jgi:hypothetical protein
MAERLFNSEFNLVSDWILENRPKKIRNKRYKRRTKRTLTFVFQEDPQFDFCGDIVQVKGYISSSNCQTI